MKIAAETVIWSDRIDDLPYAFDFLAASGCTGVEISQSPNKLGDASALKKLLSERQLTLVGLSGGTLSERVKYCGQVLKPEYLYIEAWEDDSCKMAMREGFTLALHPHVFKPIHRLAQAEVLLEQHSALKFLPDTFHLAISGDAIAEAVVKWHNRLAAIHLKDWTPIHGRSSHRYARGFMDLGKGDLNFELLFERLREINYKGWLIFEQGSPDSTPEAVVKNATTWLGKRTGTLMAKTHFLRQPITPTKGKNTSGTNYTLEEERDFHKKLLDLATNNSPSYYPPLTEAVGCLLKAPLILLCGCSPTADIMDILGAYPASTKLPKKFMKYRDSLSSVAAERQATTVFDLREPKPGLPYGYPNATFGYPQLREKLNSQKLISVPVLNPSNPHQTRFVLNVFPALDRQDIDLKDLERLGNLIAQAADSALDERCALAAAKASVRAGQCQQSDAFLEQLVLLLKEALYCEALTILLVNETGERLEEAASAGVPWQVARSERYYTRADHGELVVRVWQDREAVISPDARGNGYANDKFLADRHSSNPACLCAPMVDIQGFVIGVILCRHKLKEQNLSTMFSEDDIALLDAVCQSAIPHLQVLLSKQRRAKALRRLTHELNTPLNVIAGAVDRMKTELSSRKHTSESLFSQDYLKDVEDWLALMRGLLGNADWFRATTQRVILEQRRTHLYADVFMPAANQIHPLLKDRDFNHDNIFIEKFTAIPMLWLDKRLMTQVVFNLLSNAIKYAKEDPKEFRIRVTAQETDKGYEIEFCDWGPGIAPEMAEAIFLEGVRSKEAELADVKGDGLGLWVTRNAVQAHEGTITLTGFQRPTKFTILLPKWLRFQKRKEQNQKT